MRGRGSVAPVRRKAATKKPPGFAFAHAGPHANRSGVQPVDAAAQPQLLAGYPLWLVVLVGALAVALVFWLAARAIRVLAALVALAVIGAATWLAWQHVFG